MFLPIDKSAEWLLIQVTTFLVKHLHLSETVFFTRSHKYSSDEKYESRLYLTPDEFMTPKPKCYAKIQYGRFSAISVIGETLPRNCN